MTQPYKSFKELFGPAAGLLTYPFVAQGQKWLGQGAKTQTNSKKMDFQADQLPTGINSVNRNYYVPGRMFAKTSGTGWWQQQEGIYLSTNQDNVALSGGGTVAPKSGVQVIKELAVFGSTLDWTQTSKQAPDADNPWVNFFDLNPYQRVTGSKTDGDEEVIPAGPPVDDVMNIHGYRFICDMHNASNNPTFLKFYVCVAKQDNADGPKTSWNYLDQNPTNLGYVRTGTSLAWTFGGYDRSVVHTVPQTSKYFNQRYKVIGVIPCKIAAGADCKLNIGIKHNKTFTHSYISRLRTLGVMYPRGSVTIMVVQFGGVIASTLAEGSSPNYGYSQMAYVTTKKYQLGFCEPNERFLPAVQGIALPVSIPVVANQKKVAEDVVGNVAAVFVP